MIVPLAIIITALIVKALTAPVFVYMCGEFYKTDCEKLDLECRYKSYSDLRSLKFFPALDCLSIKHLKTDKEILLPGSCASEIRLSGCDIKNTSFFGALENAKQLSVLESIIDFSDFSNESIESMEFIFCDMDNFEKPGESSNAESLYLYGCGFTGTERTGAFYSEMHDSSVFSAFDKVKTLEIYNTRIDDISGFLDMQELKEMYFWEEDITEEQIAELENAGITVHLQQPRYSGES